MRPWLQVLVFVLGMLLGAPLDVNGGASRMERASRLLASANRRIALGTHEQRQVALGELQEAAKLDPARSDILITLGSLNFDVDHLRVARLIVEGLEVSDSASAEVWLFAGQVRRRVWRSAGASATTISRRCCRPYWPTASLRWRRPHARSSWEHCGPRRIPITYPRRTRRSSSTGRA